MEDLYLGTGAFARAPPTGSVAIATGPCSSHFLQPGSHGHRQRAPAALRFGNHYTSGPRDLGNHVWVCAQEACNGNDKGGVISEGKKIIIGFVLLLLEN